MCKSFHIAGLITATIVFSFIAGCGKGENAEDVAQMSIADSVRELPRLSTSGALLEKGYAALLVAFPEPVEEGDWLTLVKIHGEIDTDKLPRIPLASSHSVTVLNIPPGLYTVEAKAWVRKSQPYAGGASDTLVLMPGELLMLRAPLSVRSDGTFDGLTLREAGRKSWTLSSPHDLSEYIADAATKARG